MMNNKTYTSNSITVSFKPKIIFWLFMWFLLNLAKNVRSHEGAIK